MLTEMVKMADLAGQLIIIIITLNIGFRWWICCAWSVDQIAAQLESSETSR